MDPFLGPKYHIFDGLGLSSYCDNDSTLNNWVFFFRNVILFSYIVPCNWNIPVWNLSNIMNIQHCGYSWHQATVPLTIFRSKPKSDQNLQCSGLKCVQLITTKFCTCHDSVTPCDMCKILLWSVKHILNQSIPNFDQISNSIKIAC